MADGQNISQRWGDFRPSKTMLLWSCVVCIGLTMLLGFTWGGWVTGETAKEMTESAAEDARAELAAAVCVDRSEEHTSELQSLMRISYAVFCLKKKKKTNTQ